MKLFIQVPCLNEEKTLPLVLGSIPKSIKGIDAVEILIIDDGSTDKTIEVAKSLGVKHFVLHRRNMGLARSFQDGVDYALSQGADIVVNTDGDNQYPQERIADLVQPIINGQAEIVIADRQTHTIEHFSPFKKMMQRFGSWVVNKAAGTDVPDAPSGFRAYSKTALLRINIVTQFSYTMETIIQAGTKKLAIVSLPVTTNAKTRESRLFKNIWQHMYKSGSAIIRAYLMYRPQMVFGNLAAIFFILGLVPFVRYLILFMEGDTGNHLQSLLLGTLLIVAALLSLILGIIADLVRISRVLQEDQLERIKTMQYGPGASTPKK